MRVTIFGSGYVGLVQAAVLADVGNDVVCVDIDRAKIDGLRRGEVAIFEPGLERLVQAGLAAGRLKFSTEASEGVAHGDVQFIAVGTPPDKDGSADLRNVVAVAEAIATHMETSKVVVTKSTVPVGTGDRVASVIAAGLAARGRSELAVTFAANPEFLREGAAVLDCQRPDRIIIGTMNAEAEAVLRELYAPFNRNHDKIIVMDVRSAELAKYAANAMLATKISFMNEIANLADRLGADIEQVRQGIGSDPRIGYHFIYPGTGYGGSCLPKDVKALIHTAEGVGFDAGILKSVESRNEAQKLVLFEKILRVFDGEIAGKVFAIWGLSFKPNTNDMREAPSRALMEALWGAGAMVRAYDPEAMEECRRIYGERGDLVLCRTPIEAVEGADALVLLTEWGSFRAPDFAALQRTLRHPMIFDGRNLYDPAVAARHGLTVHGIGRRGAP